MSGHYIDIASGGEEKSWTKCIVFSRTRDTFILCGYGGEASLYFKDLLPEKPITLGDFLEVTFRPEAATPTGNLVTGYRSCPPICPHSITTSSNHVNLDLHLTVRFKCFIDPNGPRGGVPLYSSQFVDVLDNCRRIPLPAGGRLEETVHHVTAYRIREPNSEKNYIWVVADVLSDEQMSLLSSRGIYSRVTSPSPSAVSRANRRVSTAKHKKRNRPDQTVPTATDHLWEGSEYGSWCSDTTVDSEADIESTAALTTMVEKWRADWTENKPTLVPEVRDWWFIDEVKLTDEEEDEEELTNLNATNGSGDKKRADRYGLVPRISHLSRSPSPIASALTPPSDAADKTADSAPLAVKSSPPKDIDNGIVRTPSTVAAAAPPKSVIIQPSPKVVNGATMVPALVASRHPKNFIVAAASFDACLPFENLVQKVSVGDSLDISTTVRSQGSSPSHVVTKYRRREPFCYSFIAKCPAGRCIYMNLYVTYKCDVYWGKGMVPCFSSDFVDVIDHRRLIPGLYTVGRWRVQVSQVKDPHDRQKHMWAVANVIQDSSHPAQIVGACASREKTAEPKRVPRNASPRAEQAAKKEKNEKNVSEVRLTATKAATKPPPPPAPVVFLDRVVAAETPAIAASHQDETKAEVVPPPAATNPEDSQDTSRPAQIVAASQEKPAEPMHLPRSVLPRAEQAKEKEHKEKKIGSENVAAKNLDVSLDLVVPAETPAITASDRDETKPEAVPPSKAAPTPTDSEMLSLFARAMGDRAVRDAIQSANRDMYEDIIDRFVGVVFK